MSKQAEINRAVRRAAGLVSHDSRPIRVLSGDASPREVGRSFYWTTGTGKPVHHPNAYRKAFGKPVYHPSTRAVEVGIEWIRERFPGPTAWDHLLKDVFAPSENTSSV